MSKTAYDHQTICVSLYDEDVRRLDAKVAELNRRDFRPHQRGHRHMTRSALIRLMIEWLDVDAIAPEAPAAASAAAPATTPAPAVVPIPRLPRLSVVALERASRKIPVLTAIAMSRALGSRASARLRA